MSSSISITECLGLRLCVERLAYRRSRETLSDRGALLRNTDGVRSLRSFLKCVMPVLPLWEFGLRVPV